jgi:hypothetical protein
MKVGWLDKRKGISRIDWDPYTEEDQIRTVIDTLYREGARVNVVLKWDGSFHDPDYRPYLIVGPGVQKPLSKPELMEKIGKAGRQWARAFELSRRG